MTSKQKYQAKSYRKSIGDNNVVDLLDMDGPDNGFQNSKPIHEKLPAQLTPSCKVKDLECLNAHCESFPSTAAVCSSPDHDDVELIEVRPNQRPMVSQSNSQSKKQEKSNSLYHDLREGNRTTTKTTRPAYFDQSPDRVDHKVKSICQSLESVSSGQQACDEMERVLRNVKTHSVADNALETSLAQSRTHEFKLTKVNQNKMDDSTRPKSKGDESSASSGVLSSFSSAMSSTTSFLQTLSKHLSPSATIPIQAKRKKKLKGKSLDCTALNDVQKFFKADKTEHLVSNIGKETEQASIEQDDPLVNSEDDQPSSFHPKKLQRNFHRTFVIRNEGPQRKRSNDAANPIEIPDSEDEKNVSAPMHNSGTDKKQATLERLESAIDVARVTVGTQYSQTDCKLELKRRNMVLSYRYKEEKRESRKEIVYKFTINFADVELFKYCQSRDDLVLVILRVKPTMANSLADFKAHYAQRLNEDNTFENPQNGYIVLELRSKDNLNELLKWMNEKDELIPFLTGNDGIEWVECKAYAEIMLEQLNSEAKEREYSLSSSRKRRRSDRFGNKGKRATNKIMVVFPFGADEEEIDKAADGLYEAQTAVLEGGKRLYGPHMPESPHPENYDADHGLDSTTVAFQTLSTKSCASEDSRDSSSRDELQIQAVTSEDGGENAFDKNKDRENLQVKDDKKNWKGRAHYLTIRQEDMDRLEQGEFLNDTLIDFWMQWLIRKEDRDNSPLHVFTSHFYTTLSEDGVPAVESWTAKKNIDIFKKKFIFIPINKSLHWSLCVVVSPEHIVKTKKFRIEGDSSTEKASPVSCILFLDSLKAHQKNLVAKNVRRWLNSEWKRLKHENLEDDLFTNKSMRVISPRIPYQDNCWDCGVFVCRYAFALFMMRHTCLTCGQMDDNFQEAISEHKMFDFGMEDIRRLRDEMKALLTNLSVLYHKWNEKTMTEKKCVDEGKKACESDMEQQNTSIHDDTPTNLEDSLKAPKEEVKDVVKDNADEDSSDDGLMSNARHGPIFM